MGEEEREGGTDIGIQKSNVKNQNDKSKRKTLDLPSAMILPLLSFRDTVSSCLCEGRRPRSNLGEGDRDCRAEFTLSESEILRLWLRMTKAKGSQ